jgi:hypothetical protein
MKRLAFSLLVFVGVLSPVPVSAQDIVGSWKHRIFYQKVVSSGEKRFPFGEKIVGRSIFTKEGTYCTMTTGMDRKQSAGAPTDEERVSLFKTMYAYCGTYRVDGQNLILQADVAWTPSWTQRPDNVSWKLDGKILTVETLPFKSQLDGVDVIAVLEFEKE